MGRMERAWDSRDSRPSGRARFEHGFKLYVLLGKETAPSASHRSAPHLKGGEVYL